MLPRQLRPTFPHFLLCACMRHSHTLSLSTCHVLTLQGHSILQQSSSLAPAIPLCLSAPLYVLRFECHLVLLSPVIPSSLKFMRGHSSLLNFVIEKYNLSKAKPYDPIYGHICPRPIPSRPVGTITRIWMRVYHNHIMAWGIWPYTIYGTVLTPTCPCCPP